MEPLFGICSISLQLSSVVSLEQMIANQTLRLHHIHKYLDSNPVRLGFEVEGVRINSIWRLPPAIHRVGTEESSIQTNSQTIVILSENEISQLNNNPSNVNKQVLFHTKYIFYFQSHQYIFDRQLQTKPVG